MAHDADTFYDCHAAQFTQSELCEVLGIDATVINNWIKYGYLTPDGIVLSPRNTPLKRYSIVGITRASLIASCVDHAGLRPSLAAEIADFCAPFVNEHFERDAAGDRLSTVKRIVLSQLQRDGRLESRALYRREDEHALYQDDPDLNPEAAPLGLPTDKPVIVTPLTDMFFKVFRAAAALLKKQNRGGLDKFRRPIDSGV